jgi:hypothetical protein
MDITKVDRNVAHVAMAIHICCKCVFQIFRLFSDLCLQVFHLDVAYIATTFQFLGVFAIVSDACFKCFICLQTYAVNVSFGCFKNRSGCCTCCHDAGGWPPPSPCATALSWVTSSSGAQPPRTTQSKGTVARPPEMTQSRGMAAWVWEAEGAQPSKREAQRDRGVA